MKRKAPSPPSRAPEDQSESSSETGNLCMLFNWEVTGSMATWLNIKEIPPYEIRTLSKNMSAKHLQFLRSSNTT